MMFWGAVVFVLIFALFGLIVFMAGLWSLYTEMTPYVPDEGEDVVP